MSNDDQSVAAKVRYINAQWKDDDDAPRIGSRESRRANTSFQDVRVHNVRSELERGEIDLDRSGFTLTTNPTNFTAFTEPEQVERDYYPQMHDLVCKASGASAAFAYAHLVRTEKPIDFNDGYARFVHCDYNISRLQDMSETLLEKLEKSAEPGSTFVWYNTWQPFDNQVQNNPLACIDWATLPLDDVIDYYYTGRGRESLVAAPVYNPAHRFCYFDQMETDEVLVMKQMDPRPERSTYCPHTSFDDPTAKPDALPRRSIEMRWLAVIN
ncbi:MAG: hypothetical protein ACI9DC_005607 [Gammaproteobacteria bacterium]|jgi:hypothetical protein